MDFFQTSSRNLLAAELTRSIRRSSRSPLESLDGVYCRQDEIEPSADSVLRGL
jgi:hypothetical protein